MTSQVNHWIGGTETGGSAARSSPVYDPATGIVSAQVVLGSASDVDQAVRAAREAFPAWRDASLTRRQTVLFAFRELLNQRKSELAEIITAEHGKILDDAIGEVARGQEVVEFACGLALAS